MPVLVEPVPRDRAARLRRAVLAWKTADRRLRRPAVLHVGDPGSAHLTHPGDQPALDLAVRTEVVAALLLRSGGPPEPVVWLGRSGDLTWQDVDADWLAAATAATHEAALDLTLVVVTTHGWWDPRSGVRREWRRLRQR